MSICAEKYDIGSIVSAVANHEAKALLFLAMQADEVYSRRHMKTLMSEIQGGREGWSMDKSVLIEYGDTFAQIGLVARVDIDQSGHWGYVKTKLGNEVGNQAALLLLEFSLRHAQSLIVLLGRTSTSSREKSNRTPILRLRLYQELITGEGNSTQQSLLEKSGLTSSGFRSLIYDLQKAGIVSTETRGFVDKPMKRFRVNRVKLANLAISRSATRNQLVVFLLNHPEIQVIDSTQAAKAIGGSFRDLDNVREALRQLKRSGALIEEIVTPREAPIRFNSDQKAVIEDLLTTIEKIGSVEPEELKKRRLAIIGTPDICRKLTAKANAASFMTTRGVKWKTQKVMEALSKETPLGIRSIHELTAPDLSIHDVRRCIVLLVEAELVISDGGFRPKYSLV